MNSSLEYKAQKAAVLQNLYLPLILATNMKLAMIYHMKKMVRQMAQHPRNLKQKYLMERQSWVWAELLGLKGF